MVRRKLVEVALPLDAINREAGREKAIRHGHPSTFHLWWARRPLAACRAIVFASLVDDPSSHPDRFPTEEAQEQERERLFGLLKELVLWGNTENRAILDAARQEIAESFDGDPPPVMDPFCGGGSIPLEAQRLGLDVRASDLNPVAVLITRALVEIPPRFGGRAPVNPEVSRELQAWTGARGLADDVRYYGRWMRDEAERRIGDLFPAVELPNGDRATVIAWMSARTVVCPNPACTATIPLLNSFKLCTRKGREAWLRPIPSHNEKRVNFEIVRGRGWPKKGSITRSAIECLVCGETAPREYVAREGRAGRMGAQLVSAAVQGHKGRDYVSADQVPKAREAVPSSDLLDLELPTNPRSITAPRYGLTRQRDLYTDRQLVALASFSDLVREARYKVVQDGADEAYADAITTYLALGVGRLANRCSTQCIWNTAREEIEQTFAHNVLNPVWVYAEANPFSDSSGNFIGQLRYLIKALERVPARGTAQVTMEDSRYVTSDTRMAVVTDPPYYDNVQYADLSDFFYVWLRRAAGEVHPELFRTILVPKSEELIAEPAREGDWESAAKFFEKGLRETFERIHQVQTDEAPFVIFYAFKQAEEARGEDGRTSTGWDRMLQGLVDAKFSVTATWPVRTERSGGLREYGRNALASSIALVCRPRPDGAEVVTRRDFLAALRGELPLRLRELQMGNVPPVDLAQASIGPGMAVFSRYGRVIESDGSAMRVRTALGLINQVLDEVLREQEGEFDPPTRWAISWFEEYGTGTGAFGRAETLATAKAVSVEGLERDGVVVARGGKVRFVREDELPEEWDPSVDDRLTVWEIAQHLTRALTRTGEAGAAELAAGLGSLAELARDLAYRLYMISDRNGWNEEAATYNSLVAAWPEIARLAARSTGQRQLEV